MSCCVNKVIVMTAKIAVYDVVVNQDTHGVIYNTKKTTKLLEKRCSWRIVGQTEILDGEQVQGMNRYEMTMDWSQNLRDIKPYHLIELLTEKDSQGNPLQLYTQGLPAKRNSTTQEARMFAIEIGYG